MEATKSSAGLRKSLKLKIPDRAGKNRLPAIAAEQHTIPVWRNREEHLLQKRRR